MAAAPRIVARRILRRTPGRAPAWIAGAIIATSLFGIGAFRSPEVPQPRIVTPRPVVPEPVPLVKEVALVTCRFDGTDRRLMGTLENRSLFGVTAFNQCFAGLEQATPFTVPPQGELRATYFLRSATRLSFRLRIQRGATLTVPYDVVLDHPVVGVPTELRIPFSEFMSPDSSGPPTIVPGDRMTMISVFGEGIDCGLRLDALSLVELRP